NSSGSGESAQNDESLGAWIYFETNEPIGRSYAQNTELIRSIRSSFWSVLSRHNSGRRMESWTLMATTRTPGVTVLADGRRFIDKRYLGVRIGLRVGAITQEQAEERLEIEIARVQRDLARKAHARPTFTDCAARYVAQSRGKRSIDVIKWHVRLLQSCIGNREPRQIHDQTL